MSHTVLISICDDNELVRDGIECLVMSLGYDTAAFESAEEFLDSGLLGRTTCLISDMQMPGMSGAELQQHLLARGQAIPTIFVTAECTEGLRPRLLAAGAIDVLPKPFDKDDFIACLARALAPRRQCG